MSEPTDPADIANQVWTVLFECEAGHRSDIQMRGHSKQEVTDWMQLLDGTSPMYVFPPDEHSPIGKCMWKEPTDPEFCGKPFKCRLKEE